MNEPIRTACTFEQWQAGIIADHGGRVTFRTVGEHGWDRLAFDEGGKPKFVHHRGPKWTDAVPPYKSPLYVFGKLIGTYNHNTGIGVIFFSGAENET